MTVNQSNPKLPPIKIKKGSASDRKRAAGLGKEKELVKSGIAELLAFAIRFLQISKQVHKQQHQPRSEETQQILTKPSGEDQAVVGGGGASTKVDWAISIKENLARQVDELSIYKVPRHLREGEDKAYGPRIVPLGPYHQGEERYRQMDPHKWRALQLFLNRKKEDMVIYLNSIKELEGKARDCYEGAINMSSEAFVLMMVLDGCFVLELFRVALEGLEKQLIRTVEFEQLTRSEEFKQLDYGINDSFFKLHVLRNLKLIQRDMIMLENQIPLFILDRLLGLQLGCPDQRGFVAKLAVNFFSQLMPAEESLTKSDQNRCLVAKLAVKFFSSLIPAEESQPKSDQSRSESSPEGPTAFDPSSDEGLHFLDVFRRSLLHTWPGSLTGSSNNANRAANKRSLNPIDCLLHAWRGSLTGSSGHANLAAEKRQLKPIHCVTELRDAGIKFKKRDTHRFWDIKFENGVLEIPRLVIDDVTKSLFLNLIAFELCHLDCESNISSYVVFMDHLINSSEDVRHLHHCGIIEHWLGSDDKVAELFNRLCQEVVLDIDDSDFSGLYDDVNAYSSQRWHAWRADLKHKYFSNPWAIISVIAAFVLLLLTLTQTFYAVYGYHRPS